MVAMTYGCRLISLINRGYSSSVWRALHRKTGRVVALKLNHAPSPEGRPTGRTGPAKFRHPFLVEVYEAGSDFIVMELAEGGNSIQYLSKRFGKGSSVERTRLVCRFGAELVEALNYLHSKGCVHRDVKPANVLVALERVGGSGDPEPHIRLADFGLLGRIPLEGRAGTFRGTPAFMAPEQHRGEEEGASVDLFGMGATLLSLATGRPPFLATDEEALFKLKNAGRINCPPSLRRQLGREFLDLISALLSPRSGGRPGNLEEMISTLRKLGGKREGLPLKASRIVGQDKPRSRLARLIERAADGSPGAAIITGPSGSGRSTLVRAVSDYAEALGFRVFRRTRDEAPRRPGLFIAEDLERLGESKALRFLTASRELLLRKPAKKSLSPVLLLTLRTDDPLGAYLVRRLEDIGQGIPLVLVEISPLAPAEIQEFIESSVGSLRNQRKLVRWLHGASGGLPALFVPLLAGVTPAPFLSPLVRSFSDREDAFLKKLALSSVPLPERYWASEAETARTLLKRGLLRKTEGGAVVLSAGALGEVMLGEMGSKQRRDKALSLLGSLTPRLGTRLSLELALHAEDVPLVCRSLVPLLQRLSLRSAWNEALLLAGRAMAMKGLPPGVKACVELARSRALNALGKVPESEEAALQAVEWAEKAGDPVIAVEALLFAGKIASMRGRGDESIKRSEEALVRARRAGLREKVSDALHALGRWDEAFREACRAGYLRGEARARMEMGREEGRKGKIALAKRTLQYAARCAAKAGDTIGQIWSYNVLGGILFSKGDIRAARHWWGRALRILGARTPAPVQAVVQRNLGIASEWAGKLSRAVGFYERSLILFRQTGLREDLLKTLDTLVTVHSRRLDPVAALKAGEEALSLAREIGVPGLEAVVKENLGDLATLLGRNREAEDYARSAASLAAAAGDYQHEAIALRNLAEILNRMGIVFKGKIEEARGLLHEARSKVANHAPESEVALEIEVDLIQQAPSPSRESLKRLEVIFRKARNAELHELAMKSSIAIARCYFKAGRIEAARKAARRAVQMTRGFPFGEAALFSRAVTATITGSSGDHKAAVKTARKLARRLGTSHGGTFFSRFDVASILLSAVKSILAGPSPDLPSALRIAEPLVHCPAFCWQADVLLGFQAKSEGLPGLEHYRMKRARSILANHPELELEACGDPKMKKLLGILYEGSP